jgi:hypothetical protein
VEFSVSWALAHTPPADRIDRVVLRQDSIRYIEEASDAFWGMPKKYDFRLEGMVRELETPEDARSGTAIPMGYVDGRPANVRASFDAATYREVVRAWRERIMGVLRGRPGARGRRAHLKNTRYFRLLQEADGD